jgi:hypothetical protein
LNNRSLQALQKVLSAINITLLSLDVGCGRNKRGDTGIDYDPKSKADIICDIHSIPFRDNVFYRVKVIVF